MQVMGNTCTLSYRATKKRATGFDGMPLQNELRVLPPTFEPVLQQIRLQGLFSWVVKHAVPTDQQHGSNIQTQTPYLAFRADVLWVLWASSAVPSSQKKKKLAEYGKRKRILLNLFSTLGRPKK